MFAAATRVFALLLLLSGCSLTATPEGPPARAETPNVTYRAWPEAAPGAAEADQPLLPGVDLEAREPAPPPPEILGSDEPPQPVTIGIVLDGEHGAVDLQRSLRRELHALLDGEFDLTFRTTDGDWDAGKIEAATTAMLADPTIDLVIGAGVVASQTLATRGALPKPGFAPIVVDAEAQGLPFSDGISGVRNLNYLSLSVDTAQFFEVYRRIVPFDRPALLVARYAYDAIPNFDQRLGRAYKALGLPGDLIPVGSHADEILAAIPPDVDAVFLGPILNLDLECMGKLARGLIARKLPSFELAGGPGVDMGLLASLRPSHEWPRTARRVALNVQSVLLGEDAGTFPVMLSPRQTIRINLQTARDIDVSPSFRVLSEAELIDAEVRGARTISLESAIAEAAAANLDLQAAQRTLAAGQARVGFVRSALLPQALLSSVTRVIDEDTAEASLGIEPQYASDLEVSLNQILFDDPTWANLGYEKRQQRIRELDARELLLDVVLETATTYLDVLRARALEKIQSENLARTQKNLELAQMRYSVGATGREDVYRWSSQTAIDRQAVIDAFTERSKAELALNRLLDRPLDEPFIPAAAPAEKYGLIFTDPQDRHYIDDVFRFRAFENVMVQIGRELAPEIAKIDEEIAGQERLLDSSRRQFWLPKFEIVGRYTYRPWEDGAGVDGPPVPPEFDFFDFNTRDEWFAGVQASIPLFSGGSRVYEERSRFHTVERLLADRRSTADKVELRVRAALIDTAGSHAKIRLAREAAQSADDNLMLVSDAYSRGARSILDLLDAQNNAVSAAEQATNAEYDFLIDLMDAQRAVGGFAFLNTDEEDLELSRRVRTYIEEHADGAREPGATSPLPPASKTRRTP